MCGVCEMGGRWGGGSGRGSGGRGEGGVLGRVGGYQDIDMAPSHCSSQTGGTVSPLKSAHKFKKINPLSHDRISSMCLLFCLE